MKLKDLTGKKFGRLTVIKRVPNSKSRHIVWLCKCDCGTEKIIRGCNLRRGYTKSCGCLNREQLIEMGRKNRIGFGLANMGNCFCFYKTQAKKRELDFGLTKDQFYEITQKDCYYCGAKPNNKLTGHNCYGEYVYNGLDRIDNTKGYTIDNVVPCCKTCNYAKRDLTLQEFKNWISKVYNKFGGDGKNSKI